MLRVEVVRTETADPDLPLPAYETGGAAGADLRANLPPDSRASGLTIAPGERVLVPTGLRIAVPEGYELQVRPRSGLALRHGIMLVNSPGTVDSDYRGEVGVIVLNAGSEPYRIAHGDRIAQGVLAPVTRGDFALVETLDDTSRGAGGFGSTGA